MHIRGLLADSGGPVRRRHVDTLPLPHPAKAGAGADRPAPRRGTRSNVQRAWAVCYGLPHCISSIPFLTISTHMTQQPEQTWFTFQMSRDAFPTRELSLSGSSRCSSQPPSTRRVGSGKLHSTHAWSSRLGEHGVERAQGLQPRGLGRTIYSALYKPRTSWTPRCLASMAEGHAPAHFAFGVARLHSH